MAMAVDSQQRQFGGMTSFDHMPYSSAPHFTNPWSTTSSPTSAHSLYANSQHGGLLDSKSLHHHASRMNSSAPYASVPISSASAGSPLLVDVYGQEELIMSQDLMNSNRLHQSSPTYGNEISYTSGPAVSHSTYATSTIPAPYESMGYAPAPIRSTYALPQAQPDRRISQAGSIHSNGSDRSYVDAIDASRGMIAMSQNTTPRNIYGPGPGSRTSRSSSDSYGFPATHSTSSSISSASTYPSYFGGSVDSSVSEYSGASDVDSVSSRTLPKPYGLGATGMPPAPSSMMGQFSSKVSSSTQKKHKCKVCDKRFTRPSSLQTHMYSHTGEKPFACEVDGCGRHFSVVSNLRRHRKVHKGEARSEGDDEDHHSDEMVSPPA